jgi:hypothetical protein
MNFKISDKEKKDKSKNSFMLFKKSGRAKLKAKLIRIKTLNQIASTNKIKLNLIIIIELKFYRSRL